MMSTSYSAALVYGLTYNQAVNLTSDEFIDALIDEGDLEIFAPYYDALREDSIVGVAVVETPSYNFKLADPNSFTKSQMDEMEYQATRLTDFFGEDNVKFYLTTVGS
jgi:hypothetical protein